MGDPSLHVFERDGRERLGDRLDQRFARARSDLPDDVLYLRERLTYCSPLGTLLRAIRADRRDTGKDRSVGIRTIRRLEEAGIRSFEDLETLDASDLVKLGLRRDLAERIRGYVSGREHEVPMRNLSIDPA